MQTYRKTMPYLFRTTWVTGWLHWWHLWNDTHTHHTCKFNKSITIQFLIVIIPNFHHLCHYPWPIDYVQVPRSLFPSTLFSCTSPWSHEKHQSKNQNLILSCYSLQRSSSWQTLHNLPHCTWFFYHHSSSNFYLMITYMISYLFCSSFKVWFSSKFGFCNLQCLMQRSKTSNKELSTKLKSNLNDYLLNHLRQQQIQQKKRHLKPIEAHARIKKLFHELLQTQINSSKMTHLLVAKPLASLPLQVELECCLAALRGANQVESRLVHQKEKQLSKIITHDKTFAAN